MRILWRQALVEDDAPTVHPDQLKVIRRVKVQVATWIKQAPQSQASGPVFNKVLYLLGILSNKRLCLAVHVAITSVFRGTRGLSYENL